MMAELLRDGSNEEVAETLKLSYPPAAGAPMPVIICSETEVTLLYYVADSANAGEHAVGKLRFKPYYSICYGEPNDEGLPKHRLWGRGLEYYAFHVVHNSWWAARSYDKNSPDGSSTPVQLRPNHYILAMQDSTFECLAGGYVEELAHGGVVDVALGTLADRTSG